MAQYGHSWYGTSYYGATNAYSGWYQTKEIYTQQALKNTVNVNIRATLPSATYGPTSIEVSQIAGTWTYDSSLGHLLSASPSAQIVLTATGDEVTILYEQRTMAPTVSISVETTLPGQAPTTTSYSLNTQGATIDSNAKYVISGLDFGQQKITITLPSTNTNTEIFYFKGFIARTSNLIVESRARISYDPNNPMSDADYVRLSTTISLIDGTTDEYMVSGTTPNYAGDFYIQFKVYLASSDNATTPIIQYMEIIAGDSSNHTQSGSWTATFDMQTIAQSSSVSFSSVDSVDWTDNVPPTTTLTVRSQSSDANGLQDFVTVPYKKNTHRIRLKRGFTTGWIDTPVNAPETKHLHIRNVGWNSWDDQSFLPPDSGGAHVTYAFISPQKDNITTPYTLLREPMRIGQRSLKSATRLGNHDNVIRITLRRSSGKQTPVVDFIKLVSDMHYQQDVIVENKEFSAVDNHNTGKDIVLNLSDIASQYQVPAETSNPIYSLIDNTQRPNDVVLYYDSESAKAVRKNITSSLTDKVWAEVKLYDAKLSTGLKKNYQYGGGQVKFPNKDEVVMSTSFTPSLVSGLKYRYHLDKGWPQEYYTSIKGDTLSAIANNYGKTLAEFQGVNANLKYNNDSTLIEGQSIAIPNDSVNSDVNIYWKSSTNDITSMSASNALLDGNASAINDSIMAEVATTATYKWVDWISEEKIYDGVINLNDIRSEYKRIHLAPTTDDSSQVKYTVLTGDTYESIALEYGVYEDDVRRLNNASPTDEPTAGQIIQVPARITLPKIDPKAIVAANPFQLDVIFNSVKKKDGKILAESNITTYPLTVEYQEVQRDDVEITRGSIVNGKDLLPDPMVTQILSAKSGIKTFNVWNDTLQTGDFKQDGNYIDWSASTTSGAEPAAGEVYTVSYKCKVPKSVTTRMDTTYYEEGGVDRIWRSPEVKEFSGICSPGSDYVADLPSFNTWKGLPDNNVEDIQYVVEDNDLWVKTSIEKQNDKWVVVGSLQDRIPKDNWFPTIKTGYYYLGKDEYYLFSEPITFTPKEHEIPVAENINYVEGKFDNAAKLQESSQNLVRNSGFDVQTTNKTVYRITF